jgi:predicted enzyme involved in methoxymalonyl-ACP biosynthesis
VRERIKCLATHRVRRLARQRVNERLAEFVAKKNASAYDHLFVLDETPLLKHGELELGRMFYDSDRQHPAVLGKWVAQEYRDILAAQCQLLQRKLIICDLDNTLWNGVIGEGRVAHYTDRQAILKALKSKGIVLSINSKNDPKNVHWTGGILCADDFVGSQINWNSKVTNVKRIA